MADVRLRSGHRVDPDLFELVRGFVAAGRVITVTEDGASVEPAPSETAAWIIDNAHREVRLILDHFEAAAGVDWTALERQIGGWRREARRSGRSTTVSGRGATNRREARS